MELDLHVTNRCNLLCKHCIYEANDRVMDDIDIGFIEKILPDIKQMEVKEVHLTGGEPLVNPHIFDVIELLKKRGFIVRLQTNGSLMTTSTIDVLKKLQIDSVMISVDGLEDTHNFLRSNASSFEAAINAITLCSEAGIYTRANTVLHKKNIVDVIELIVLLNKLGVNQHSFFYLSPGGRGIALKDIMLSLQEWKEVVNVINQTAIKNGCLEKIKVQNLLVDADKDFNECRINAKDNCLILSNGDVYPCVFFINSEYCLGNIFETELLYIWNDDVLWKKYNQAVHQYCNNNCMGGCMGMTYLLKGEIHGCDPRCNKEKKLIPGCIRRYVGS